MNKYGPYKFARDYLTLKMDRYGCPYKFARDYLTLNGIKLIENTHDSNIATQVIWLAIEALEEKIQEEASKNEEY